MGKNSMKKKRPKTFILLENNQPTPMPIQKTKHRQNTLGNVRVLNTQSLVRN